MFSWEREMRTFARLYVLPTLVLCLAIIFISGTIPADAHPLDDDATAKSAASSANIAKDAKPIAPAANAAATTGLTERERMLRDRVEQLERRVAELEAAHQPASGIAAAPVANSGSPGPAAIASGAPSTISTPIAAPGESSATFGKPSTANSASANSPTPAVATSAALALATNVATQLPEKSKKAPASDPFAFADFTWLNGNPRTKEIPLDTKFFTPEIRSDVDYIYDFRHPKDDTISGSSEVFRASEVQLTQLGFGGDFHYDNVRARIMTQFGLYSETAPRNDASPSRGQWNLADAYRYLSEAYGGYHFNVMHGINVDAGIFMSYVGLFSYYQFDNWAYQPSYVSSNTPWFFNGVRVQIFPTEHLKIEPWFTNGWQSYGRFNNRPGIGVQILWRPNGWLSVLGNQYMLGEDALNTPGRVRYHTDDSIQIKYYDNPEKFLDKMAFSLTGDLGCEHGGGVSCYTNSTKGPKQDFLGFMFYNRAWFDHDLFGLTIGGGKINNPGRYLVLLPPINGANAASGTPNFTENPGDPYKAWDMSGTFDYMPSQYITFRWEYNYRAANVPYFSGPGGVTPPGGNQGVPGSLVSGWAPDLRKNENRLNMAILVKF
jgi:hypothetical protein